MTSAAEVPEGLEQARPSGESSLHKVPLIGSNRLASCDIFPTLLRMRVNGKQPPSTIQDG